MNDERRIVTILFADVSGSTALGESMDPEDMRALLGRYYALAREVVSRARRGPQAVATLWTFDRAGLEEVIADWKLLKGMPDSLERLTSAMSDRLWRLPTDVTKPQLEWAVAEGLRRWKSSCGERPGSATATSPS